MQYCTSGGVLHVLNIVVFFFGFLLNSSVAKEFSHEIPGCAVNECFNRITLVNNRPIQFIRFPNHGKIFLKWIKACNKTDPFNTEHAGGEVISSIGPGLCVLIGISREDTQKDIDYIARKILNLRLFGNDERNWSDSVVSKAYEVLCLSQITLYSSLKGNKVDFHKAMAPQSSKDFYQQFLDTIRQQYIPDKVKEGVFGAKLVININNDGPVTICLESPQPQRTEKTLPTN